MDKKLLGIIDATAYPESLDELIRHRSLAALPFGGRYRLIDFTLSNMVNSGITSVAIFTKNHYRSLMDHLGSGKDWDLSRKRDGLFFFPYPKDEGRERGNFHHFAANIDYLLRSSQEYALITNSHTIGNIDFKEILQSHIHNNCDITEIYKNGKSLRMYLLKTSLLKELIETRHITNYHSLEDVVEDVNSRISVCRYEYLGYAQMIDSIQSFYQSNLQLLNPTIWKELFYKENPIYTKVKDEPPTKYVKGSIVKNSVIANGCQIEGYVENSIIFRGAHIKKGAVVKNSIIMQKSTIGENCELNYTIVDKDVICEAEFQLTGSKEAPIVIPKGTKQGALMKS